MNIIDVVWLLGQTLALAWLACGAIVTILESHDLGDFDFPVSSASPPELHAPASHRLESQYRLDIDW